MTKAGPKYFPTAGHLLVCQGQNCQNRGSRLLYQALWQALDREHLAYYKAGGQVRLTESGCLGACSYGPTLCVYRERAEGGTLEQGWYAAMTFPQALNLARAVQDGLDLPAEGRYGPGEEPAP
ncbi:(2Fe-2S) ferredoxin domain-containing protein [Deinococcus sp. Marseille-Q6407]|uniref:(2Fe-2S) ferredoxin domain-containing protein n=1 Tax=Deinococcus sp. Marseille-Q6407 TaxID=2969223 RepID=UPI0021BEA6AC|nr:NAD(P)H-dependent oxidoreductase subunit E [Deinococcus sp. Marseille-Q6407]